MVSYANALNDHKLRQTGSAALVLLILIVGLGMTAPSFAQTAPSEEPQQAQNLDGPTERLFQSIVRNDLAAVRGAVAAGADITARNKEGVSPGDLAVELRHFEIVGYLLSLADQAAPGESLPVAPGSAPTRNRELFWQVTPVEADPPQGPIRSEEPKTATPQRDLGNFQWSVNRVNRVREPKTTQIAEVSADDNPYAADIYSDAPSGPQLLTDAEQLAEAPSIWGGEVQQEIAGISEALADAPFLKPDPPEDFFIPKEFGGEGNPVDEDADLADPDADLAGPSDPDADLAGLLGDDLADADGTDGPVPSLFGGDQTAGAPASLPKKVDPLQAPTGKFLTDTELAISSDMKLNQPLRLADGGTGFRYRCIDKEDAITVFCVEPIGWPSAIEPYMGVTSVMYSGDKYITRYDGAISTRIHALYPTEAFDLVAAHFQKQFGPATEALAPIIAPFAKPRQTNPTVIWRSEPTNGNPGLVLEIRKFDNLRSAFPDLKRGAVMLYTEDDPTIFDDVSPLDFMLSKKEDVGQSQPQF